MREIITLPTGKVDGIKGLYHDASSGRFWVRYSFHGIDKQRTFVPKKSTFSGLERQAAVELNALKKEVLASCGGQICAKKSPKNAAAAYRDALVSVYKDRVTEKSFHRLERYNEGFQLGGKETNDFNKNLLLTKLSEASEGTRAELYGKVGQVFRKFIASGLHTGIDPTSIIKPPKKTDQKRTGFFTFGELAKIEAALASKSPEFRVFFLWCVFTGQRPNDVLKVKSADIVKGHLHFWNSKTSRFQRVKHIIPADLQMELNAIGGKFSYSFNQLSKVINKTIKDLFPAETGEEQRVLYTTRHSFLTNLHSLGYSIEDCSYFTHAGKDVCADVYTHQPQEKADKMLLHFWSEYKAARAKQAA